MEFDVTKLLSLIKVIQPLIPKMGKNAFNDMVSTLKYGFWNWIINHYEEFTNYLNVFFFNFLILEQKTKRHAKHYFNFI
jgi:hypothetical protein